mmetsp:Transcript_41563/g.73042  ORF Transcript_41563/g.73042 Transcript_41563/m.73042 type:complete len:479 (-) Transcript_41563:63-1499(-)
MDRGIPVGNKICARREAQRRHELHCVRVKNMRSLTDTSEPVVLQMDHIRNNLKKEQMLEERYSEIDRENRILLKKMSDIMKQSTPRTMEKTPGPQSLNRDFRKKELLRITKENQSILKRIQQAQPIYNHVEWECHHHKQQSYLRNCAEYPLVLKKTPRKESTPTSELLPLPGEAAPHQESRQEAIGNFTARTHVEPIEAPPGPAAPAAPLEDEVKYVLKEGHRIGTTYYLVEMSTRGHALNISAFDGAENVTLDLVLKEKVHRRVFRECNGDYSLLVQRLRVENGYKLILAEDMEPQKEPSTARSWQPTVEEKAALTLPLEPKAVSSVEVKAQAAAPLKRGGSRGGHSADAAAGKEELDADAMVAASKSDPAPEGDATRSTPSAVDPSTGTGTDTGASWHEPAPASPVTVNKAAEITRGDSQRAQDVFAATIGSVGAWNSGNSGGDVSAEIEVSPSTGEPMVRLRGLTPSSGRQSPTY